MLLKWQKCVKILWTARVSPSPIIMELFSFMLDSIAPVREFLSAHPSSFVIASVDSGANVDKVVIYFGAPVLLMNLKLSSFRHLLFSIHILVFHSLKPCQYWEYFSLKLYWKIFWSLNCLHFSNMQFFSLCFLMGFYGYVA